MTKIDGGLRALFHKHLPEFDWAAIETGPTTPGVPDTNAAGQGVEFWIEMKRTASHRVQFRPFQVPWINRRVRAGGRVWVAIRRLHEGGVRRGPPVDELWLISGRYIIELDAHGIRGVLRTYHWVGGPSKWGWAEVQEILAGPF